VTPFCLSLCPAEKAKKEGALVNFFTSAPV
jgi:hypothetical protein